MRERKGTEFINAESVKSGTKEKKAPRARNRTVMLNAEETQSVRSKLKKNLNLDGQDDGFLSPKRLGEKSKQLEETYEESDVFISDDVEETITDVQAETEVNAPKQNRQRRVTQRATIPNVEASSFDTPSEATHQESQSTIVLEEPQEFEESADLIESVQKEMNVEKHVNANDKFSVVYSNSSELIGFLVLVEKDLEAYSKYVELKKGRLIVTSIAPKGGDFLLINDDTVSPMHAVLRIADKNSIQILDQLSEQGSKVVKAKNGEVLELLGDKSTLEHGDLVSFGEFTLKVCLIG